MIDIDKHEGDCLLLLAVTQTGRGSVTKKGTGIRITQKDVFASVPTRSYMVKRITQF